MREPNDHPETTDDKRIERLDDRSFHPRLSRMHGAWLVVFTSAFCGACKRLLKALEEADLGSTQVKEVDAGESPGLVGEYEVFHLPAMFLFVEGEFHCAVHCVPTTKVIERAVAEGLSGEAEQEP